VLKSSPMMRYIVYRGVFIAAAALLMVSVSFFLVNAVPSNPAGAILGSFATEQGISDLNHKLGLDKPLLQRYFEYMSGLAHGDLGTSYYTDASVLESIKSRIVGTIVLIVPSLLFAWIFGTLMGGLAAVYRGSRIDTVVNVVISMLQSVPHFVIGLLGALLLSYSFGLLPAPTGQVPVGMIPPEPRTGAVIIDAVLAGDWNLVVPAAKQLVLPVLALGLFNSVLFARTVRTTLAHALESPYTEFATARGISSVGVKLMALRASLLPTVTYAGIVFANLVGGTAIIEIVFSWQALGQWGIQGIQRSDLPVIQGFVLVAGALALLAYLAADFAAFALDPRTRRAGASGVRTPVVPTGGTDEVEAG